MSKLLSSLRCLCAALLCGVAVAAPAAEPPVPLESFFRDATVQGMALSPSGRWLAAQAGGGGMRVRLVVIDTTGREPAQIVAVFKTADVSDFRWVSDDWLVFSVASPDDRSHDRFGPGLSAVRRDGKELRLLIKRQWEQDLQARDSRALTPLHRMLAVGAPGSNEIIVGERHYDSRWDLTHVTPKLLDVSSGATRSLPGPRPPSDARGWWFDHSGQARLVSAVRGGRTLMYWADRGATEWRLLFDAPVLAVPWWPAFVDADDNLYASAIDGASGEDRLYRVDLKTAALDPKPIVSTPGFDASVRTIRHPQSGALHGLRVLTETDTTVWLEPAMQALQAKVDARLPGRVNGLWCSPCDNPPVVLVHSFSDRDPGQFYLLRPEGDHWTRLGPARPEIDPARMARMAFHRSKARDGLPLPLWITAVPQAKPAPRPAVVLVHGGPWVRGGRWRWDDEAQFLASRGYVVIEPEFRGSTGYGDKHYRAGWKQWGQAMQDDVSDALRYAVDQGLVDPARVCIAGASYGGYATLMGLVKDPAQYQCGVSWVGVTDPLLLFTVHWSDISVDAKQHSLPQTIGDPDTDAKMLSANSPLAQAARIQAPVLLAYGSKDMRVPLVHGEKMRQALTEAGNPPEWVVYEGEGHGWSREETRLDFWRRVEVFLAKHLQPPQ